MAHVLGEWPELYGFKTIDLNFGPPGENKEEVDGLFGKMIQALVVWTGLGERMTGDPTDYFAYLPTRMPDLHIFYLQVRHACGECRVCLLQHILEVLRRVVWDRVPRLRRARVHVVNAVEVVVLGVPSEEGEQHAKVHVRPCDAGAVVAERANR